MINNNKVLRQLVQLSNRRETFRNFTEHFTLFDCILRKAFRLIFCGFTFGGVNYEGCGRSPTITF